MGKIGLGAIFDRLGTLKGSILGGSVLLISAVLLHFAHMPAISGRTRFLSASAAGVGTVSPNYLAGANFGSREFPLIFSVVTMASSLGVAIGNPLSGWIFDVTDPI